MPVKMVRIGLLIALLGSCVRAEVNISVVPDNGTALYTAGDTASWSIMLKMAGGAPWNNVPPTRFLKVPDELDLGFGRVVKIERDEEIDLYTGKSGKISHND